MEAKDQDGNESEKRNVLKIEEGKELIEPDPEKSVRNKHSK